MVLREAELAVWRALASVETAYDEHWDTLCAQTVGETVAIWDRVFRDLFVAQYGLVPLPVVVEEGGSFLSGSALACFA